MAETKLPTVHIPMAVDTRGIDSGLSAAERKVRASARKMAAIEARSGGGMTGERLALGRKTLGMALQRSGVGGGIGELAGMALGGGTIGLAAAGLSAGFLAFDFASRKLSESIRGASAAFDQFNQTGQQTFAASARVLEGLAKMEEQTKGLDFFTQIAQAFQFGRSEVGEAKAGSIAETASQLGAALTIGAAGAGSVVQGGSFREGIASGMGAMGEFLGFDAQGSAIVEALLRATREKDDFESRDPNYRRDFGDSWMQQAVENERQAALEAKRREI